MLQITARYYSLREVQKSHCCILILASDLRQRGHIALVLRMAAQAWQKSWTKQARLYVSFVTRATISFTSELRPSTPSTLIEQPRMFREYLLTADWDMQRISATWSCFMPCSSTSFLAMKALIAGTTDFAATSHGSIKMFHPLA